MRFFLCAGNVEHSRFGRGGGSQNGFHRTEKAVFDTFRAVSYTARTDELDAHLPGATLKNPHEADVVFALTGDVRKNSRAQRQISALADLGLRIVVVFVDEGATSSFEPPKTVFRSIKRPLHRGPRFFWALHRKFTSQVGGIRARVYHASDLYALPALASAAKAHGGKLAYDSRELYPHVPSTVGRPWVRYFWQRLEKHFIRRADAVFTVSDGIAGKLVEFYCIDPPTVVYNVPEHLTSARKDTLRDAIDHRGRPILLHLGQLRRYRGCELLLDAMTDVEEGILVFVGDGPLKGSLERTAADLQVVDRVFFLDPVPPNDVVEYSRSADVGVTMLEDICLNRHYALPNKLFEYLAAGLPVIASDLPDIRRVVRGYDVGQVVRPDNRDDVVAALRQALLDRSLRQHWQSNIPKVLETFNWERASHDFLHVYNDLLRNP